MRILTTFKTLGVLLMILSVTMLPPAFVAWWYHDGGFSSFIFGFVVTLVTGLILWSLCYRKNQELKTRDGFLVVSLLWIVLSWFSAIPLMVTLFPKLSITDAMFESVSGLTTTGATVLTHLNVLPHGILYYRLQLHLLGGLGIIVLAVAVLPMLGIGGMQLYRAEIAGPVKTNKLRPRIAQTAKALWVIYVCLVLLCLFAYHLAGMPWFDAICSSFSTISTGGFSIHDSSFAYYHSAAIDIVGIFFMLMGATNFSLHFHFVRTRKLSTYFYDLEFFSYLFLIVISVCVVMVTLLLTDYYHNRVGDTVLNSFFTVVSMSSTTGLTTTNFSIWPTFLPYFLLMVLAYIGGCAGSTSGGLKMVRFLLVQAQSRRELYRLIHPKAIWAVKLGDEVMPEETIQAVWAFAVMFLTAFVVLLLCLLATGLDITTAIGALAACLSNTGAGIGKVAGNFDHINLIAKWVLIVAMLVGRLEMFTLIVLFVPGYWRN